MNLFSRFFRLLRQSSLGLVPIVASCVLVATCAAARPATPEERTRALTDLRREVAKAGNQPSDSALAYFERNYPQSEAASLARFRRGYDHFIKQEYDEAADLLDEKYIQANSRLGAYALFYQGRALFELGKFARAQQAFSRAASSYPNTPLVRDAQLWAGKSAAQKLDLQGLEQELKPLLDQGDGAALLLVAQTLETQGKSTEATGMYQRLYFEAPHSTECSVAVSKLPLLGIALDAPEMMNARQWQIRADRLFENKQFVSAAEAYAQLEKLNPSALQADQNRLRYGISLVTAQKYPTAIPYLNQISSKNKELYPEALFYLAKAERRANLPSHVGTTERFLSLYPKHPLAGEALADLAAFQEKRGQGVTYYARLMREYPNEKTGDDYSFKRAWKAHEAKNYAAAVNFLIEHVGNYPDSDFKGKSAFWAARDAERINDLERALALYEAVSKRYITSLYGSLASDGVKRIKAQSNLKPAKLSPSSALGRALNNVQPAQVPPETAGKEADAFLNRASDLRIIGLMDLAMTELEAARSTAPRSRKINLEIARVNRDKGDTLAAMRSISRAHPDYLYYQEHQLSREEWDLVFPMVEWETIQREARANGLDPFIVAGLIRQESVFNPRAKSRANALGLMQLLPSTGRMVAKKSSVGAISEEQLYNPRLNIQLGTIYLSDMVRKFGRYEYAFAAYNGGPGRVSKWLQTLPSDDLITWVESIPITETRLYVHGVLRNASHYRRLYGEKSLNPQPE
ncbi:MAG: transglycosylase SLT domain-containing protein [Acidobacteria bacterium]|nr:transglycosylase SLT domain-containing protein [Acidobacteriota bacterium]